MERKLKEYGAAVRLHTEVREITEERGRVSGVVLADGKTVAGDAVIIATGGLSYPTTGSTGDGYKMAERLGHTIVKTAPALVPLAVREQEPKELQGLSLKNIRAFLLAEKSGKILYEGFGEMLFTHYGVSGPLILSAGSYYGEKEKQEGCLLRLDLKPALTEEQLDKRILRDFEGKENRRFKNVLGGLFPVRLIPVMIRLSGICPDRPVNEITREERRRFVSLIKNWQMHITGTGDYTEAIVTRGGIHVKEVNPSTMESVKLQGLYFAGEVLDLDGLTGGFNLQIAWSTGYLAGEHAALQGQKE